MDSIVPFPVAAHRTVESWTQSKVMARLMVFHAKQGNQDASAFYADALRRLIEADRRRQQLERLERLYFPMTKADLDTLEAVTI